MEIFSQTTCTYKTESKNYILLQNNKEKNS